MAARQSKQIASDSSGIETGRYAEDERWKSEDTAPGLVVSAVKKAEKDNDLIVRVFNSGTKKVAAFRCRVSGGRKAPSDRWLHP